MSVQNVHLYTKPVYGRTFSSDKFFLFFVFWTTIPIARLWPLRSNSQQLYIFLNIANNIERSILVWNYLDLNLECFLKCFSGWFDIETGTLEDWLQTTHWCILNIHSWCKSWNFNSSTDVRNECRVTDFSLFGLCNQHCQQFHRFCSGISEGSKSVH